MYVYEFPISRPFIYNFTGKFEAPSEHWIHEDLLLFNYELFVMTEGTLYLTYNNENYTVSAGEFLLLPPLPAPNNHRRGLRPSRCSFYWLHFETGAPFVLKEVSENALQACACQLPEDTICIPRQGTAGNQEKIIVLMKQLQDAVKNLYKPVILNYMSTVILCELFSQFYTKKEVLGKSRKTQKQIYHDIIDFVKLNINRNLKVSDVAAHFGYNEKYLSHLFGTVAGIPLKQFILTNKINAANFMLTDTNKSISEIAHALGFSDSHNFSRAYKKISGLSPSEYRNAFAQRMLFHV